MPSDNPLWLSENLSRTVVCVGMAVPSQHANSAVHPLCDEGRAFSSTADELDSRACLARPLLMTARSCASLKFLRAFRFFLAFLLAVLKRLSVELDTADGEGIVEYSVAVAASAASSLSTFSSTTADEKLITEIPLRRRGDWETDNHPDLSFLL